MPEEVARLTLACAKQNDEICQILGKALGYPWFKDDQKNFPGADETNGVCVGEHVAESIASEAASRLAALEQVAKELEFVFCEPIDLENPPAFSDLLDHHIQAHNVLARLVTERGRG